MNEQKVWIEKMPELCEECPYLESFEGQCKLSGRIMTGEQIYRKVKKICPLQSIKDHDREKDNKIKELEQKVQELQKVDNERAFRLYCMLYDLLEEKDPENVASRIEYMTRDNYADICEIYKTVKNLKQHDRELARQVCEKIRKTIASTVDLAESNQQIKDQFHIILDLVEKEFEK